MSTAAKVVQHKEKHPERYCPTTRCLWRTNGGYCPRHARHAPPKSSALEWIRNGFVFPGKPTPGEGCVR